MDAGNFSGLVFFERQCIIAFNVVGAKFIGKTNLIRTYMDRKASKAFMYSTTVPTLSERS